ESRSLCSLAASSKWRGISGQRQHLVKGGDGHGRGRVTWSWLLGGAALSISKIEQGRVGAVLPAGNEHRGDSGSKRALYVLLCVTDVDDLPGSEAGVLQGQMKDCWIGLFAPNRA